VTGKLKRPEPENEAAAKAQELSDYFLKKGHAIVAYSGGVDSALLAFAAH
jgi:PP-loop superfamily ATP-utilizing enzyme